jgi:hypothetical protein
VSGTNEVRASIGQHADGEYQDFSRFGSDPQKQPEGSLLAAWMAAALAGGMRIPGSHVDADGPHQGPGVALPRDARDVLLVT